MTLEQFASLSQIIGLVLVIASLVYVAQQLRQTTTMMRVKAASERLERDFQLVLPIIESRELAEVWIKGGIDFEDLHEADKQRLLFFERRAIVLWHHMYHLRTQDLLPHANWQEQIWIIQHTGRRQSIREAWDLFRGGFDTPFQDFVDGQFVISDNNLSENQ